MSDEPSTLQYDFSAFREKEDAHAGVIRPVAEAILSEIPNATLEPLVEFMGDLCWRIVRWRDEDLETGVMAKESLRAVERLTKALAEALNALGPGAREVMLRSSDNQALRVEAQPEELPTANPHLRAISQECSEAEYRTEMEIWKRGGRWLIRLEALGGLAEEKAMWVEQNIRKGGQKSFEKLFGQSQIDWLLKQCKEFLVKEGCDDNGIVRKMARSIEHAATGKPPGSQWGRKAADRLFQTPSK